MSEFILLRMWLTNKDDIITTAIVITLLFLSSSSLHVDVVTRHKLCLDRASSEPIRAQGHAAEEVRTLTCLDKNLSSVQLSKSLWKYFYSEGFVSSNTLLLIYRIRAGWKINQLNLSKKNVLKHRRKESV